MWCGIFAALPRNHTLTRNPQQTYRVSWINARREMCIVYPSISFSKPVRRALIWCAKWKNACALPATSFKHVCNSWCGRIRNTTCVIHNTCGLLKVYREGNGIMGKLLFIRIALAGCIRLAHALLQLSIITVNIVSTQGLKCAFSIVVLLFL